MKQNLLYALASLVLISILFHCADLPSQIRPDRAVSALILPSEDGSYTWEVGDSIPMGIGLGLIQFIDSALIQFGDATDTTLDLRENNDRYDTLWLWHRYTESGTMEVDMRIWVQTLGEQEPRTKEIQISCNPAEFTGNVIQSGTPEAGKPFFLAAAYSGTPACSLHWYEVNRGAVTGDTTDTLRFPSLTASDTGSYYCIVANTCGTDTSDTVTIPSSLFPSPHPQTGDTVEPNITLISHTPGQEVNDSTVIIGVKARDASGIEAVVVNGVTATLNGELYQTAITLPDTGTHRILVQGTDASDNHNTGELSFSLIYRIITVDSVAPAITLMSPANGAVVSKADVLIKIKATDASDIDSVTINNKPATLNNGLYESSVTFTDTGAVGVTVSAWDASDRANKATSDFSLIYRPTVVDTTPPVITPVSPQSGAVVTNATIPVTVSVTDESGIAAVSINGQSASLQSDKYQASVTFDSRGTQTITIAVRDAVGNADTSTFDITYDPTATDTTPPAITLLSHNNGDVVVNSSVLVSVEVIDDNGISSVTIDGEEATLQNGRYQREVTLASTGPNTITIRARDASSHENIDTLAFTLTLDPTASDTIPPETTPVSHQDGQTVTNPAVTLIVEASDANGIAGVTINGTVAEKNGGQYRADVTLPDEGLNTIECIATDASRNANTRTLKLALIYDPTASDDIAPVITPIQPKSGDTVSVTSILVRINATDANGIAEVSIAGANAALVNGAYERTVAIDATPGNHDIAVTVKDASSNHNTASQLLTIVYDPTATDNTPPVISREYPPIGQVLDKNTVLVKISATDENGISTVTIDGEAAALSQGLFVREVTLKDTGVNEISVSATDNSSSRNTTTETFEIMYDPTAGDNTPPSLTLTSPTETVTTSPVTVTLTITDPNGVAGVQINDQPAVQNGSTYSLDLDLVPGDNDLRVYARDESYNKNDTTRTFVVKYDPPPPPVTVTIPATSIATTGMTVTWDQSTITDFGSYKVLYGTSATSLSQAALYTTISATSHTLANLAENTRYYVQVVVYDTHGSSAGSEVVDARTAMLNPPAISLLKPHESDTGIAIGPTFKFQIEAETGTTLSSNLLIATNALVDPPDREITGINGTAQSGTTSFAHTLGPEHALEYGRKYYWKVVSTISDGAVTKTDTSAVGSFYTINQTPQWKSLLTFSNWRNQTIEIDCADQIQSWISAPGHSPTFSLVNSSGGSATISNGNLVWTRPWNRTDDTVVTVRVTDEWQYGKRSAVADFVIQERSQPGGTEGMRYIPAGSCAGITVSEAFWMDTTEVTQERFEGVMGFLPSKLNNQADIGPKKAINWARRFDAMLFCNKLSYLHNLDSVYSYTDMLFYAGTQECSLLVDLVIHEEKNGYKLPKRRHWQYAYRAGTTTDYYWGKNFNPYPSTYSDSMEICQYAWWGRGGSGGTGCVNPENETCCCIQKVGQKIPNQFGLYDMAGNVYEWMIEWYQDDLYYALGGGYGWGGAEGLRANHLNVSDSHEWPVGFRVVRNAE